MEKIEHKPCMRCGAELIEVPKEDYIYPDIEEDGYSGSIMELKCPKCGTYYSVTAPQEEEREYYPAYNHEAEDEFVDSDHGYDGLCPVCGHHIVWQSDFMRSEVWGDTETLDESATKSPDTQQGGSNGSSGGTGSSADTGGSDSGSSSAK